ncbi:hypothetical protein E3N88_23316 [Mikania micrantha]|uniref:Uncharacterized protein n=1 Tax=Mikania micrantha TaxID=192012 RepID=A0A5N6NFI7_9ASTR|nr:hypothetical protein E3N88_23316 [Mikania micrantha]
MNAMRTTHLCIGIWILISYTHHRFISSVFFFSGATSSYASYPPNDLLHIGFSLSEGAIPTDLRIHASYPSTARFRRGRKTTPEQPPPPGQLELRLLSSFAGCGAYDCMSEPTIVANGVAPKSKGAIASLKHDHVRKSNPLTMAQLLFHYHDS